VKEFFIKKEKEQKKLNAFEITLSLPKQTPSSTPPLFVLPLSLPHRRFLFPVLLPSVQSPSRPSA
jgi:hypothetical protein